MLCEYRIDNLPLIFGCVWQECWDFYSDRLENEKKNDWRLDAACELFPCKFAVGIACALEYVLGGIGGSLYCALCD